MHETFDHTPKGNFMKGTQKGYLALFTCALLVAGLACGLPSAIPQQPDATLTPIAIGSDLTKIDVCKLIPQEDIESVMERQLVEAPKPFSYYDSNGTSGCKYDGGKDASGNTYFGYVVLTPVSIYMEQPLNSVEKVSGIGDGAFFTNGADARQLWVKIDNKLAFVVAFGDRPNEGGSKAIARLVAAAIK
jgi:hypothetical protein